MKRLNPETGKPFVRGDTRADGFIFVAYQKSVIKNDGLFKERWYSPQAHKRLVLCSRKSCANWHSNNSEIVKLRKQKYRLANIDKERKRNSNYCKLNLDKFRAYNAKRRAAKLQRTPKWITQAQLSEIEDFYTIAKMFQMYTGETYHVDHIVPLQGKKVSGLHVPWNLQILPATENLKKNNRH